MAQVTVKINGYAYTLGCENGQERHLHTMAQQVEERIESAKTLGGPSGEGRLLVLTALLMADELHDTRLEMDALKARAPGAAPGSVAPAAEPEPKTARRLSKLAAKAEDIAATLDQA